MNAASPDLQGSMLTKQPLDALRYDGQKTNPAEVSGIMNSFMPSGVRVLDVGSGPGSMTLLVNDGHGNDITCIEPDIERAKMAESRGLNVHRGFLDDDFARDAGLFDVVTFADVLEHAPAPADLLAGAFKVLKPGGLVIASVPNVAHWTIRLNLIVGRFDYAATGLMDATHLRWFTEKTFRTLFERSGFDVETVRHSAGTFLPQYREGPLARVPRSFRDRVIRRAVGIAPRLFGCQHVIVARRPV